MAASTVGEAVMIAVAMAATRYLPSTSRTPPTATRNTNQPSGDISEGRDASVPPIATHATDLSSHFEVSETELSTGCPTNQPSGDISEGRDASVPPIATHATDLSSHFEGSDPSVPTSPWTSPIYEKSCLTSNSKIVVTNCPPPLAQSSYHLDPASSSPQTDLALDYGAVGSCPELHGTPTESTIDPERDILVSALSQLSLHPTFQPRPRASCIDHADPYCATGSSVGVAPQCRLAAQAIGIELESLSKKVRVGKTLLANVKSTFHTYRKKVQRQKRAMRHANQCRHNLESMNRELKRGIEDTQQQLGNMIKSQKAVIEAHLSTLKSSHNEELARAKDDAEKEVCQCLTVDILPDLFMLKLVSLRCQIETLKHAALDQSIALETCNQELVRTKDDAEQELISLWCQIETLKHGALDKSAALEICNRELIRTKDDAEQELHEIIHTHERKEALALQHVAAMQAEFGILTKELQARYHEVPLVPVIQRLHSQILELSSALQWGGPIQSPYQVAAEHGMAARGAQSQGHSHFQCTQIPDVEARVVQTDSRRTLSKGIQVRCTRNGETQTEHLPKSDKSVQLRCTRTGQAQTEAQPTSDKSVQLRFMRTGQAQAKSSPPSHIVQTQTEPPQASTRLEAESGREALSSPVPAQEALTPMTPTRMASTSASTTSFTFRMTGSPSCSIMRSGRPNSPRRPRETISRGTSIEPVAGAPDAGMRKRGRSASNSPEGDTHGKRRKPSEDSGDLDDPFEDTQPETQPLTSADVKELTAKQINHLLAALRKVGVKFPNTKSPKVETRRRWLFDALAGPITITIFEALTLPETDIVQK
ncbi:hypothetical protein PC9H_002719 [Pleurotus ostreatus]|uniref:Uncharacterized protein n=1 Tax=Pleurotus ostreatus TaxID=5322 RepID=A0A8H6ZM31_PLEOS|nr:uncharacterized protein PC9H_002719 [Pleurotus ostreatus]KAF7416453.1 hypothetical protein PC9H_002719 [Pleurotus ostreatus]